MVCTAVIVYFVGILVASPILRNRAGLGQGRLQILGPEGVGLDWLVGQVAAMMFWPITLVIWLARGCPEPRIVFNHKADERRRRVAGM